MVHNHHSHHDPNLPNYISHVMNFRNTDFCIGCLGSKFFLILILPVMIRFFIFPNVLVSPIVDWTVILILWASSLLIYSFEFITGKRVNNIIARFFVTTYLLGSIFYVILVQSELNIGTSRMIMMLFATPQIGIYVFKIMRKGEFTHSKIKLLVRLLFIISFFFSLINFSKDIFGSIIVIFGGSMIFMRSKNFSDYRIRNDQHLISAINTKDDSVLSRIFDRLNIFDPNGEIRNLEPNSSIFKKSFYIILLGILYLVGFILITSYTPMLSNCNSDAVKSLAFSTPWIIGKANNEKYCTNCGTASPTEYKFCESCGTPFQMKGQGQSNIPQQDSYYPPQDDIYQGNRGYSQQQYPSYGSQSHRRDDESKKIPIFVGIAVFLVATLGTGSIVLGIVLGIVGYFGTLLAMSTNNPCLSYCIMNQVCNCICSAMDTDNRRRGNF